MHSQVQELPRSKSQAKKVHRAVHRTLKLTGWALLLAAGVVVGAGIFAVKKVHCIQTARASHAQHP